MKRPPEFTSSPPMNRTRWSLFYLAGYLMLAGVALMVAPGSATRLLFSNREYDDWFPRLAGVLLLALSIIVIQVIRARAERLYPTTLIVRAIIAPWALWLYMSSRDPMFLAISIIVGFGLALTGISYLLDRRRAHQRPI